MEPTPLTCVQVLLAEPVGLLDYALPPELAMSLEPGMAVRLPLGQRQTHAYVVRLHDQAPAGVRLRPITDVDEGLTPLPPLLLRLLLFAADYYAVLPGEMLRVALPRFAKPAPLQLRLTPAGAAALAGEAPAEAAAPVALKAADRPILLHLQRLGRPCGVTSLVQGTDERRGPLLARLRRLRTMGLVARHEARRRPRLDWVVQRAAAADPARLGARQGRARRLWEALPATGSVCLSDLRQALPWAQSQLQILLKARLVVAQEIPYGGLPAPSTAVAPPPQPTPEQAAALVQLSIALTAGAFAPFLLQGITGSGKTEVYLRIIAAALELGRSALVLVPEIALTPQLGAQFRARFGARIAIFHSGLGQAERRAEWERVARGEATIGLGARSALFLPLRQMGVIIVDEEHETSFKQEEGPRYNARDLAVARARLESALVVLGSATPSLESHANALAGRYTRLVLSTRVAARPLPEVHCIQLGSEQKPGQVLSEPLVEALRATVAAGEQAILFLNRRGFAPYVFCHDCGHSFRCADCDVSLTLHRRRGLLLCHYCGFYGPAPSSCSACGSAQVGAFGLGTERIEAEVRQLLPEVGLVRLDRDVVRQRDDLERVLGAFRRGEAQVMVGTQMVAKGHDFPNVTLVGVVAADASLNFPDFRAAERTFQLLTQVAGRAGRGSKPGRVLFQTFDPDHYAIRCACAHDFAAFVAEEMQARRELDYPPYARLALLRWEGPDEAATLAQAEVEAALLRAQPAIAEIHILGPAPAPMARLRGLWRFQLLLKARGRLALHALVRQLPRPRADAAVRRILDIDPVSML